MSRPELCDVFDPGPDHRPRNVGLALAAIVVVAAAGIATNVALQPPGLVACATGIVRLDGDCVGVTDGSYPFDPSDRALVAAERCVLDENKYVADQRQRTASHPSAVTVTVAFLGPLTSTGLTTGRVPHQLEGACTAQHRVNRDGLAGSSPLIRLVLANEGRNEGQWQRVVGQIEGMQYGPDHLVAVVGLGLSQKETVLAAKMLSRAGIPMVGDVITADGLDTQGTGLLLDGKPVGKIPGLTRVTPSVGTEVTALGDYLRRGAFSSAILVTDRNGNDLYSSDLASDFRAQLASLLPAGSGGDEPFDGPHEKNEFDQIARNLCGDKPPDLVLYAGREQYLPDFLKYLSQRECQADKITVVTGSDASALTQDRNVPGYLKAAPITVLYAVLTDPMALDSAANPFQLQFRSFRTAFQDRQFAVGDLDDGWAIMSHDALLTATRAIRNAAGQTDVAPNAGSVLGQLYLLKTSKNPVDGAGGTFQLDGDSGDPVGRLLPLFQLDASGRVPVELYKSQPTP
jgi:hypothetical protein